MEKDSSQAFHKRHKQPDPKGFSYDIIEHILARRIEELTSCASSPTNAPRPQGGHWIFVR